jgi:hypothetical protein
MNALLKSSNFVNLYQIIRIIIHLFDIDRLQFLNNNQICKNVTNVQHHSSSIQQFYLLTRTNKTSYESCDLEVLDLVEMEVYYNYIYFAKEYKVIMHARNFTEVCGTNMVQTDINIYLLNFTSGLDIESKFQMSTIYQHTFVSTNLNSELDQHKEQLKEDCKVIQTLNDLCFNVFSVLFIITLVTLIAFIFLFCTFCLYCQNCCCCCCFCCKRNSEKTKVGDYIV